MGRHQIVMQGDGVGNEFNDSCIECQGKHLVGPDSQTSLASRLMVSEQTADLLKDLFHDCVLPQVIVSSLVLEFGEYRAQLEMQDYLPAVCTARRWWQPQSQSWVR